MATLLGESLIHLEPVTANTILNLPVTINPAAHWFVVAQIDLPSGTRHESAVELNHPTYQYEGRVMSFGSIDMSVGVPSGMPQKSGGQIRIADTDLTERDALLMQTPRRHPITLKLVQEGGSVSLAPTLYKGQIVKAEKGPGYVQIDYADRQFDWLDEPIPPVLTNGSFMPIITGICVSAGPNPQGAVLLPHVGYDAAIGDRWGLAQHPCWSVPAVYRKLPNETMASVVEPGEYAITPVAITIGNVDYNLRYLDFLVEQPEGTIITADVHGIYFRGSWNGYPAVGYDPIVNPTDPGGALRNAADFFINMTFLIFTKAGLPNNFDAARIMALRDLLEALHTKCDGALTTQMTPREFLGRFCSSTATYVYPTTQDKISLGFVDSVDDSGRPHYTEKIHIERNTYHEWLADPTLNKITYNFAQDADGKWYGTDAYDNVYDLAADQTALNELEEDTVNLYFVRESPTARLVIANRASFQGLGSYRQTWTMPMPEVYAALELMRQVGVTHREGFEAGGYHNKALVVTNLNFNLDTFRVGVKSILRTPA